MKQKAPLKYSITSFLLNCSNTKRSPIQDYSIETSKNVSLP